MTDEQANEQTAEYFNCQGGVYSKGQAFKKATCSDGQRHVVPINSDGWACCTVHGSDCTNRDCHNCQLANEINETRAKKLFAAGQTFTVPPIKAYPVPSDDKYLKEALGLGWHQGERSAGLASNNLNHALDQERGIVRRSRADNIEQRIKLAQVELDKAIAHLGELVKSISELR